jgi:5-methylcytosine-specific restriction endonuclease McrA
VFWGEWGSQVRTWIFQGNPDRYDIDGYLAARPAELLWLVTRYESDISVGDRVYLWRNQGASGAVAGVVAEGIVTAPPSLRNQDMDSLKFWREPEERNNLVQMRAGMRIIKVASTREVIRREWCLDDPILRELTNLRMQAGTNYPVTNEQALRLGALWTRTGRDWTRNESIAGLWAYAETYGQPVSRLPRSPVARIALLVGRAVSGVYAKVMNFRSIDPRAAGEGMSGAGETDRQVWNEFFDSASSLLRTDALTREFNRLWLEAEAGNRQTAEVDAAIAVVADEAGRLEELSFDELLTKYQARSAQRSRRPTRRVLNAYEYDRDPLVITIARKRAGHRCEARNCAHPTFETSEGVAYTEVHHIIPLADGGEDTINNVACLCPAHHREVHLGVRAVELTNYLLDIRRQTGRLASR